MFAGSFPIFRDCSSAVDFFVPATTSLFSQLVQLPFMDTLMVRYAKFSGNSSLGITLFEQNYYAIAIKRS